LISRLKALKPGVVDIDCKHGVIGSATDSVVIWYATGVKYKLESVPDAPNVGIGQRGVSSKCICAEWKLDGV